MSQKRPKTPVDIVDSRHAPRPFQIVGDVGKLRTRGDHRSRAVPDELRLRPKLAGAGIDECKRRAILATAQEKIEVFVSREIVLIVAPYALEFRTRFREAPKRLKRTRTVQTDRLDCRARRERYIEPRYRELVAAFFHEGCADLRLRFPNRHFVVDQRMTM